MVHFEKIWDYKTNLNYSCLKIMVARRDNDFQNLVALIMAILGWFGQPLMSHPDYRHLYIQNIQRIFIFLRYSEDSLHKKY